MSMSLRDQLLAAGLISAKQAKEAERQQQHQQRQQSPKRKRDAAPGKAPPRPPGSGAAPTAKPAPTANPAPNTHSAPSFNPAQRANLAQSAKLARDQELNRKQQEKAHKKALLDQIRQLIDKNRLPLIEGTDSYNFVDGDKVRRIAINADARGRLTRGEIAIVRHAGRYDLVPLDTANRIRERDEQSVIVCGVVKEAAPAEAGYEGFAVPDDLMW
jgi:uncharacterized protein YaiL (DUF2058 family)